MEKFFKNLNEYLENIKKSDILSESYKDAEISYWKREVKKIKIRLCKALDNIKNDNQT